MGESSSCQGPRHNFGNLPFRLETQTTMSEEHFDEFEHYNFDQDKAMRSGHSGKQRAKKEASMNTNKHNPGGHERKIVRKLMNAEKNNMNRVVPPVGGGSSKHWADLNPYLLYFMYLKLNYSVRKTVQKGLESIKKK